MWLHIIPTSILQYFVQFTEFMFRICFELLLKCNHNVFWIGR